VPGDFRLRGARLSDADLLLAWRNDPLTRRMSHEGHTVEEEPHIAWLTASLKDPDRHIYIAEIDGIPVGTVRADHAAGIWELSWTVAPTHRSRGIGKKMVSAVADLMPGSIKAVVKAGNIASIRIAECAGMRIARESEGLIHLERSALHRKT